MATKPSNRVPMYHPWKRNPDGSRSIQLINKQTVKSGLAAKMGYLPVPQPEAPPVMVVPPPSAKAEPIEAKVKVTKAPKTTA